MKKAILLLLFVIPIICFSQKKEFQRITLKNGAVAVLYDDFTWEQITIPTPEQEAKALKKYTESQGGVVYTTNKLQPASLKNNVTNKPTSSTSYSPVSSNTKVTSSRCGAPTKKGGACQRLVSGGGRCYQH